MGTPAARRLSTAGERARRTADDAFMALARAVKGFFEDNGPQFAAGISYYGLFSLFPLAILMVAAFGLVVDDDAARRQVIDVVLENVPLREERGRSELENVLINVTRDSSGFGVLGVIGLVLAASAVMGTVRQAVNRAWGVGETRPPVQGKLLDIVFVAGLALLITLSFGLTLATRLTVSLSASSEETLGPVASLLPRAVLSAGQLAPALVAFIAFLVVFRLVPATTTRLRDVWPGAAFAAVGFELAKTGFSVYLANFSNYGAVYASLAAVVAFLVFIFVTANLFLIGAELAVEWPKARDEQRDDDGPSLGEQVKEVVLGLFVRRG